MLLTPTNSESKRLTVTGTYLDSGFSDTVRIVENPIVRANGDSRSAPDGEGQAEITWNRIAGVADGQYTIRTRKLYPPEHYEIDWYVSPSSAYDEIPPAIGCESQPCHSLPDKMFDDSDPTGPTVGDRSRLTYERMKLELGELYGIQLNYKTSTGHETIHVFSAHDVYVWPSKGLPGEDDRPDRVATFPFFGHHVGGDYGYRICKEGFFPDDVQRQTDWIRLIEHAFEQWEIATDGLITVTPEYSNPTTREYKECTNMSLMRSLFFIRRDDDALSEIRMLDVNLVEAFLASNEIKSDPFKKCILSAPACVTSRTDYDDDDRGPSNPLAGVDVTFNRGKFEDATDRIDAQDGRNSRYPRVPSTIRFNTCLEDQYPDAVNVDPDLGYYAYTTALHEAGHALGLSNVTDQWRYLVNALTPFVNPFESDIYHASHSSTPDSVMNYDSQIRDNYDPVNKVWKRPGREPDCFPHPFDVLAIYALYQVPSP